MKDKSILDDLEITSPCPANWDLMVGDERERFCHMCSLNVYNISSMSKKEAEEFLESRAGGRVCLNLRRRPDGTVILDNCPQAFRAARLHARRILKTVSGAVATALVALLGPLSQEAAAQLPQIDWGPRVTPPMDNGGFFIDPKNIQEPSGQPLKKQANTTDVLHPPCASKSPSAREIEKRLRARIDETALLKKTDSIDGARNHLDMGSFLRSKDRLEESRKEYDRAIEILRKLPDARALLKNAELNRDVVSKLLEESKRKIESDEHDSKTQGH